MPDCSSHPITPIQLLYLFLSSRHARARAHTHTHIHTRERAPTHARTHARTHAHTHTHARARARVRARTHNLEEDRFPGFTFFKGSNQAAENDLTALNEHHRALPPTSQPPPPSPLSLSPSHFLFFLLFFSRLRDRWTGQRVHRRQKEQSWMLLAPVSASAARLPSQGRTAPRTVKSWAPAVVGMWLLLLLLLVGWLLNVPKTGYSVSQGWIYSDNFRTETEVADQTFCLTQSQYTETGPNSPCTDPVPPGA